MTGATVDEGENIQLKYTINNEYREFKNTRSLIIRDELPNDDYNDINKFGNLQKNTLKYSIVKYQRRRVAE